MKQMYEAYLVYCPDDEAPNGERYLGMVHGVEAAKHQAELAKERGVELIFRSYESMVD